MPVELFLDARAKIAESLLWAPAENALYWADIKAPALHRIEPATGARRAWALPAEIGGFALLEDGGALVALRTGLHRLDLADGALDRLAEPPFDPDLHRFNEGACDAAGRFWIGVMFDPLPKAASAEPRPGFLCVWSRAAGLVLRPDAAELHNGMAWSPDGSRFYLTHSREGVVWAHDFDAQEGRLGAPRPFVRVPPRDGIPDGAAVDETGAYWCAIHGGGRLHRYAPDGGLIETVPLPVSQPTMCAFGGPNLDTLFITSASDQLTETQRRREPHAGGLFRYQPGVRGTPRACVAR